MNHDYERRCSEILAESHIIDALMIIYERLIQNISQIFIFYVVDTADSCIQMYIIEHNWFLLARESDHCKHHGVDLHSVQVVPVSKSLLLATKKVVVINRTDPNVFFVIKYTHIQK